MAAYAAIGSMPMAMVIMGQLAIYAYECGSSASRRGRRRGVEGLGGTEVLANGVHKLRTKPVIEVAHRVLKAWANCSVGKCSKMGLVNLERGQSN